MCSQLMIVFVTIGCTPGSRVPSPHDDCNTCICGEDGSIGACTRILCSDGKWWKQLHMELRMLNDYTWSKIFVIVFGNFR